MEFHDATGGGVDMTVKWTGIDKFTRFLNETPGLIAKDVEAALYQEGQRVMAESKRRTPVDTGNLRATGHTKLPERRGGKVSVRLAYGTDYAIYVHEVPASHASGQSKFLESAVKDNAKGMTARMRAVILSRIVKRAAA